MKKNENETFETFDITDEVIAFIISKYDEIGLEKIEPDKARGYDKIRIAFNEIEKRGIQELYARMWKQFPFDANSKTARSTDASPAKIRRFVNN